MKLINKKRTQKNHLSQLEITDQTHDLSYEVEITL